jgi:hypothetical protein
VANTLTGLIPTLYESLDIVSRELVGFIPSIAMDASAARAAVGQQIMVPITPASQSNDITPGVTAPNTGDQIIGETPLSIAYAKAVPFRWNGEEQKGLNTGPGYAKIKNDQITQAMRTLCNGIEGYVAGLAYVGASRATGTAGTTPFATDLSATANARKVLSDNGSPLSDIHLTMNTTAGAKMRTLTQLTKANEAADDTLLRQGVLLDVHGFEIRESAQIGETTAGTGAGYVVGAAGAAAGSLQIPLVTGTGTVVAGDVVSFAGDPNKYVVAAGGGIAAPGTITINKPGLLTTLASGTAMTIGSSYAPNLCYHRNAIALVTRAPALPTEGDMAVDRATIIDPRSGLAFDISMYLQYRQVYYEMAIAYGAAVIKPEHVTTLMG